MQSKDYVNPAQTKSAEQTEKKTKHAQRGIKAMGQCKAHSGLTCSQFSDH